MKRFFATVTLSVVAIASLAGCGSVPGAASTAGARGPQASWSSPTVLVALRGDAQRALLYQRTMLGTDEVKPGADRVSLELVVRSYRQYATAAIARAGGAADLKAYASRLDAARKRDVSLKAGRDLSAMGAADLAWTAGEYHSAFKTVADDIDGKLGVTKRERPE